MAKAQKLGIKELQSTLDEFQERFQTLSDDELFVLWFLRAYITESEVEAAEAVVGGSRDKNIDGVLIDEAARTVFVIQTKYRKTLGKKSETRSDIIAFSDVANRICDPSDSSFKQYVDTMEALTADRIKLARKRVMKKGFRLRLFFVTLGKISPSNKADAKAGVRKVKADSAIEMFDSKRCMVIFRDYLDGVSPPIPMLDLEMEAIPSVTVNGIANRFDRESGIESWVFSMRGDAVGSLYEMAGIRLFARNIRGFLGSSTAVNDGMIKTLKSEPERFFYYNNGVTIICDAAERKSSRGRDILQVSNPQVINGQQTTRTLASVPKYAGRGSVLVKVICVPRTEQANGYDDLVSKIVAGTNWQNAIKPSDLMSNDRRQIELERALRKIGYFYLRKRQTKGEARRISGAKRYQFIKKEEFAQAVAGCNLDPLVIRSGREHLFEEGLYSEIFPNSDPNYFLPRLWLMRAVTYGARGVPQRGYVKWLVLNFVWSHIEPHIKGRRLRIAFRTLNERKRSELLTPLAKLVDRVYVEALRYYRANRGTGKSQLDISLFFRSTKGRHKSFAEFWSKRPANTKATFKKNLAEVASAIGEFDAF